MGRKTRVATVAVEEVEVNETASGGGVLVTPGKRKKVNRDDLTALLNQLSTARSAMKDAHTVAEEARQAIIEIAGDAEILTDRYGIVLCRVPESSRSTLPVKEVVAAIPEAADYVRVSWFRRVTR
jgi:hypothetical protein